MKKPLENKLITLSERYEEISHLLSDAEVIHNNDKFRELSKEYAELQPVVDNYAEYKNILNQLESSEQLLSDEKDSELKKLIEEECEDLKKQKEGLEENIQLLLLPQDPQDSHDSFL